MYYICIMNLNISIAEQKEIADKIRNEINVSGEPMTDLQIIQSYVIDEVESRRGDGEDISEDDILCELRP